MENVAWQLFRKLHSEHAELLKIYLYEIEEFCRRDSELESFIKIYLVEAPEDLLSLLRAVAPQSISERCICGLTDFKKISFNPEVTEADNYWLIQDDIVPILAKLRKLRSKLTESKTEFYLFVTDAESILTSSHLIVRSVRNCELWRIIKGEEGVMIRRDEVKAWYSFLARRSEKPRTLCQKFIALGTTAALPGFKDLKDLLHENCQTLHSMDFWSNRRLGLKLLRKWGSRSCQLHPNYQEYISQELRLISSSEHRASSQLRDGELGHGLDDRLISILQDRLIFPMEHSSMCETPKLLIYQQLEKIGLPLLDSNWVDDYIVRAVRNLESVFVCELYLADVLGKYVGESEQNLTNSLLFAEKLTASYNWVILVIHDLDLLHRDDEDSGVERNLVTNLLMNLDGVSKLHKQLIIIGVSKKNVDLLDDALIRPGRLEIHIPVLFTFS